MENPPQWLDKQTLSPYKAFERDNEVKSNQRSREGMWEKLRGVWVLVVDRRNMGTFRTQKQIWNTSQELHGREIGSYLGYLLGLTMQSLFCNCFPREKLPGLLPFFGGFLSGYLLLASHSTSLCSPRTSERTSVLSDDKHFVFLVPPPKLANARLSDFHKWKISKPRKSFLELKGKKETLWFIFSTQVSIYFKANYINFLYHIFLVLNECIWNKGKFIFKCPNNRQCFVFRIYTFCKSLLC